MSRSYRKMPIIKDGGRSKKIGKKFANQKVRITKDLSSHCYYKKSFLAIMIFGTTAAIGL